MQLEDINPKTLTREGRLKRSRARVNKANKTDLFKITKENFTIKYVWNEQGKTNNHMQRK